MRSSISSSEPVPPADPGADPATEAAGRLPEGSWGRCWLVALLLACSGFGGLEALLREREWLPTVIPDKNVWSLQRQPAAAGGSDTVAILGTSRAQTGFDSRLFRREYPQLPLAMLPISATDPAATLEDLAKDTRFRGLVLCELFSFSLVPLKWDTQKSHLDYYHSEWRTGQRAEFLLRSLAQRSFVAVNPSWRRDLAQIPQSVLEYLLGRRATLFGAWKGQPRIFFPDGSVAVNYAVVDPLIAQHNTLGAWRSFFRDQTPISAEEWAGIVARFAAIITKIQDRGGRVVLLNYPTAGPIKEAMDSAFPRERYWDVLAREPRRSRLMPRMFPACPDITHPTVSISVAKPPSASPRICWRNSGVASSSHP